MDGHAVDTANVFITTLTYQPMDWHVSGAVSLSRILLIYAIEYLKEWPSSLAVSVITVCLLLWVLVIINFAVSATMPCRNQAAQPP